MEIMYTREGITGSNPVLSANKIMRKTRLFILVFSLWFILGVLYVSWSKGEEENVTDPKGTEFNLDPDPMDLNDSISIRQIKQMDSLHAAGKF